VNGIIANREHTGAITRFSGGHWSTGTTTEHTFDFSTVCGGLSAPARDPSAQNNFVQNVSVSSFGRVND
jgi:hypothetical protein